MPATVTEWIGFTRICAALALWGAALSGDAVWFVVMAVVVCCIEGLRAAYRHEAGLPI